MPGPESRQLNIRNRTISITQGHRPSHDIKQHSISKVSKTSCWKTISKSQCFNLMLFSFSCLSLTCNGFFWWGSLPCAHSGTQSPSILQLYPPLSPRGPHHSASTWEMENRWGFCEPGLEVAPIILLTFHWAELRHMTTSSCKGNIVQLCPKDEVRARIWSNLCNRLLADFTQNHIIESKFLLLFSKSFHSKHWPIKEHTHFLFIVK